MPEKIVIGVDGSVESRAALEWGLNRATARRASVLLLNIADDTFLSETPAFIAEATEVCQRVLEAELAYARELGFTGELTGKAVLGHPVGELERASKGADLLVLGAHHGSKLAGTFFGTRAVKIAAAAHCPVAVIPLETAPADTLRVVVGVDGSDHSKKAVATAAHEAALLDAELHAIYAWMPPLTPGLEHLWSSELITQQEKLAAENLAIGTAGITTQHPDLRLRREIVQAPPVQALLDAGQGAHMPVVGSRGRGSIARLLLGSVSHGVLQELPCPVLVTRA